MKLYMKLMYIDPGTGSMLFAVLIGLFGALRYLLRSLIVKAKFRLSGGKAEAVKKDKLPLVVFSDDKRYWNIFEPVLRELDKRGIDITYMTASKDDPALSCDMEHVHGEFIGQGNKAFARLNFLNAAILLSTTPGLEVYQWKRSRDVNCYIHMLHMPNEISGYRMFGTDYYDTILISGDFQERIIRRLESLRNLPPKEIYHIGIPYMDEMAKRLKESPIEESKERVVLLAPSWGKSAIFNTLGEDIIEELLKTGYHIIIRPHPQSFTSEKELLEGLMKKYPTSDKLEWNRDNDNFEVLKKADILISDFSGVIFDFALVYDKPVIYTDTDYKSDPYDTWWLDEKPWTFSVLEQIGIKLTKDELSNIKSLIDKCLTDESFKTGRDQIRNSTWEYQGQSAVRAADFLEEKLVRVSKHSNLRLHGLFRASHSHNPASIRIPVALSHHFILIEGRVINSISHRHASMPWKMSFDTVTKIKINK